MNSILQGKYAAYIGFAIALVFFVLASFDVVPMTTAVTIMALAGFPTGIVGMRAYINSQGWKTYFLAGISVVIGVLMLVKVLDPEQATKALGVLATLAGVTLTQATAKAQG